MNFPDRLAAARAAATPTLPWRVGNLLPAVLDNQRGMVAELTDRDAADLICLAVNNAEKLERLCLAVDAVLEITDFTGNSLRAIDRLRAAREALETT